MAKSTVTAKDLETNCSARFYRLPKALTKKFVRELFDQALEHYGAKKVGKQSVKLEIAGDDFAHSFLCYSWQSPVPFLKGTAHKERHYGFLLLIERKYHLAVFYKGGSGFDKSFIGVTKPVSRDRLTHAWSENARYQKLGTRRMAIARQELRGASYEADDLETSLPLAVAGRSIPQTLRLQTADFGPVAITPSTGRVQKGGGKALLVDLVEFVDETLEQLGKEQQSAFLAAFPSPMELEDLPATVEPSGVLVDLAILQDVAMAADTAEILIHEGEPIVSELQLYETLSQLRELKTKGDDDWIVDDDPENPSMTVSRLTHSYKLAAAAFKGWTITDEAGKKRTLAQWVKEHDAFSLTFTEPDYFYTAGSLYRKAGFKQEATNILSFIQVKAGLTNAESEKGDAYTAASVNFAADSIFRILETDLAHDDTHLCCCDLGDEWADYLGFGPQGVTFYHCKDGDETSGASDFQIVIAQALKNLSRIGFRTDEIKAKLESRRDKAFWGNTGIALLVRPADDWNALINTAVGAAKSAGTVWTVALVVTALSKAQFETGLAKEKPKPSFIQLVWLLSAFISGCRDRGAQPVVFCRA